MGHKGTPQSSQMMKMADMISDLEDRLYAAEASNENLKGAYRCIMQKLDRKTVECDEARKWAEKYQSLVYSIACFQNTVRVKEERLPWTKEDIEADEVAWQKAVDESAVIK